MAAMAPQSFKGIAVFTPGGDVVYCRDDKKQTQWHLHLCAALQEQLGLVASPYFLVPGLTATVDCWIDPVTASPKLVAELYPLVYRYQGLLNALFGLGPIEWRRIATRQEYQSISLLNTHQAQFPQLWDTHDLILDISSHGDDSRHLQAQVAPQATTMNGPVLRLFVSGYSAMTEQVLKTLQGVLENSRYRPYTLRMVDVSKHPEQAEADQISATPTLVRVWPQPTRRLVGELDNPRAILSLLSDP